MRPTICSLFEPHHKQTLYANPKRTAKSFSLTNRYHTSNIRSNFFLRFFLKEILQNNVAENSRALSGSKHPCKRRLAISLERVAQGFFFACTRGQRPDLPGCRNRRITQRDAARRRLDGGDGTENRAAGPDRFRVTWK